MSKTKYFLTAYITEWDAPSQFLIRNIQGFNHKLIDVDQNPEVAEHQNIRAVPTVQIYNGNGDLVGTKIGAATKAIIETWVNNV